MRIMSAVAAAVIAVLAPFAMAGAAAADELQVSSDGVHFSDSLKGPLFDPDLRWVPGDTRARVFSVRNATHDPGRLRMNVLADTGALADSGAVVVTVTGAGGTWVKGSAHARQAPVPLGPGRAARITVRVDFLPSATNTTQSRELSFRIRLTLDEVARPGSHGSGGLPSTGAPAGLLGLAALGLTLLALGSALLRGLSHWRSS
jgi:hypothetical protein